MGVTTFLVAILTALAYNADAVLTWTSPVTPSGTLTRNITEGATVFNPPLIISASTTAKDTTVTYTSTQQDPFQINKNTGEITLTKALDYESQKKTYTLTVTAIEVPLASVTTPKPTTTTPQPTTPTPKPTTPTPQPTAAEDPGPFTATVTINVQDVPTFEKNEENVCIPDGSKAGDEVTTLPIADTFNDSPASYSKTGTGNEKFVVNETNGKVTVASGTTIAKGHGDPYTLIIQRSQTSESLTLTMTVGDCSGASLLAPLGLLTLLMALIATVN